MACRTGTAVLSILLQLGTVWEYTVFHSNSNSNNNNNNNNRPIILKSSAVYCRHMAVYYLFIQYTALSVL